MTHDQTSNGSWTVEALHELLRTTPHIGLWLDASDQTAEQTVDEIGPCAPEVLVR